MHTQPPRRRTVRSFDPLDLPLDQAIELADEPAPQAVETATAPATRAASAHPRHGHRSPLDPQLLAQLDDDQRAAYLARRRAARQRMFQRRRRTVGVAALVLTTSTGWLVLHGRHSASATEQEQQTLWAGLAATMNNLPTTPPAPATPPDATAPQPTAAASPASPPATPNPAPSSSAPTSTTPSSTSLGRGVTPLAKPADPSAVPAMDPRLISAWKAASAEAASQGVKLTLLSGSRSWALQEQLHAKAVKRHGSEEVASQWVLPPAYSMHVRGKAIDVAEDAGGAAWLQTHGNRWGLCRPYENEAWHFELIVGAGQECPARITNAAG